MVNRSDLVGAEVDALVRLSEQLTKTLSRLDATAQGRLHEYVGAVQSKRLAVSLRGLAKVCDALSDEITKALE